MAVDYSLLHHFEASWSMETAIRNAAAGVAARQRQLMTEDVLSEPPAALVAKRLLQLSLAEDDR